jgi:hypothetical protein
MKFWRLNKATTAALAPVMQFIESEIAKIVAEIATDRQRTTH